MIERTVQDEIDWCALDAAAGRADVDAALRELIERTDSEIAARGPRCDLSGRCCRFESYGHRLYVTALEVAWVVRALPGDVLRGFDAAGIASLDGCAFQDGRLCGVHAIRPLGCRVFFCDPTAASWQNDVYEAFLGELRAMHDRFGVAYRYMEWRAGLASRLRAAV